MYQDNGDEELEAEFIFDGSIPARMGLHLEPALKEMIWFEKVK